MSTPAERIDEVLPQTQCTQCGYAGCRPYAQAIAEGAADINRCPPGGEAVIALLAQLLGVTVKPLDPVCGVEQPRRAASIDEQRCIGCTFCIQACPVDAILGAPKQMHAVLIGSCTGCELCVAPCPVDCIEMIDLTDLAARGIPALETEASTPVAAHSTTWRSRYQSRLQRLDRERQERDTRLAAKAAEKLRAVERVPQVDAARKHVAVTAALERARARLRTAPAKKPGSA